MFFYLLNGIKLSLFLWNIIYSFIYSKVRESDVFVLTYPKVGTTWTQEIVWNMRNNPDLKLPSENADSKTQVPFLE